jgi:hypothetical protein
VRPHCRNAFNAAVNSFTAAIPIRHFVMAITGRWLWDVALPSCGQAFARSRPGGEFVGKKIAKLERRLNALERKQRGFDDGDVVDLPSPLLRKRSSNAA